MRGNPGASSLPAGTAPAILPSSITCIGDPAEFPHVAYPDGRLSFDAGLVGLTITGFAPADDRAAKEGSRFLERPCHAVTTMPKQIHLRPFE